MEKSLEQLKHIERISRQTRHHRTHLNHIYDQNLRLKLSQLTRQRELSISRSASRQEQEEKRRKSLAFTIDQITVQREFQPSPNNSTIQIADETTEIFSKTDHSRATSSVRLPSPGLSCHLFSQNCQLYPCQPVYQYRSFIRKENDQTLGKQDAINKSLTREKKLQQDRQRILTARQDQNHRLHQYVAVQRSMARLNEQSRLLHERLAQKKPLCYTKERRHQLTQDIQRHLNITARFCT